MSDKAIDLLKTFASELDKGKPNSFYQFDYVGCTDDVINELVNNGYIVVCNDICGTIQLTHAGYDKAKR